jgi:hypothetical protein
MEGIAQADLTGEWDVLRFTTNDSAGWELLLVGVDAAGVVTTSSRATHDGDTALPASPPPPIVIDGAGNVLPTGAALPSSHGRMTRTKTLIIATEDHGAPTVTGRSLVVWRKRVAGVTYGAADLAGLTLSYHAVYSGPTRTWFRGTATTDASGVLSFTDFLDSTGASGSASNVA